MFKKLAVALVVLISLCGASHSNEQAQVFAIGQKRILKKVSTFLEHKVIDPKKTCLDEYMNRHKQLVKMLGLGPLGGILGAGTTTAAGVGAGVVGGGFVGGPFGAILAGSLGGVIGAGAGIGALTGYQIYSLTALLQNRYLIKVIANARDGEGKSLRRFYKSVSRRLKGNTLSTLTLADHIREADRSGALCDGSLVRKGKRRKLSKLRHFLANKREIIKHLKQIL